MPRKTPDLKASAVISREGQKDRWIDIGVGFLHSDGKGFNILLDAYPVSGKIILRPFADNLRSKSRTSAKSADLATSPNLNPEAEDAAPQGIHLSGEEEKDEPTPEPICI